MFKVDIKWYSCRSWSNIILASLPICSAGHFLGVYWKYEILWAPNHVQPSMVKNTYIIYYAVVGNITLFLPPFEFTVMFLWNSATFWNIIMHLPLKWALNVIYIIVRKFQVFWGVLQNLPENFQYFYRFCLFDK